MICCLTTGSRPGLGRDADAGGSVARAHRAAAGAELRRRGAQHCGGDRSGSAAETWKPLNASLGFLCPDPPMKLSMDPCKRRLSCFLACARSKGAYTMTIPALYPCVDWVRQPGLAGPSSAMPVASRRFYMGLQTVHQPWDTAVRSRRADSGDRYGRRLLPRHVRTL